MGLIARQTPKSLSKQFTSAVVNTTLCDICLVQLCAKILGTTLYVWNQAALIYACAHGFWNTAILDLIEVVANELAFIVMEEWSPNFIPGPPRTLRLFLGALRQCIEVSLFPNLSWIRSDRLPNFCSTQCSCILIISRI